MKTVCVLIAGAALTGCSAHRCARPERGWSTRSAPIQLTCKPLSGYSRCVRVAARVESPVSDLFAQVAGFRDYDAFFDDLIFSRIGTGTVAVGEQFKVTDRDGANPATWRIVQLSEPRLMSGVQVEGPLAAARFDHRFHQAGAASITDETWHYTPPGGPFEGLADLIYVRSRLLRTLCGASERLGRAGAVSRHENPQE